MRMLRISWAAGLALAAAVMIGGCAAPGAKGGKAPAAGGENDPQYQVEKGVIALRYGLTDEAIRYGDLAIALDAGHFNAWNLLGSAYYTKGDFAKR